MEVHIKKVPQGEMIYLLARDESLIRPFMITAEKAGLDITVLTSTDTAISADSILIYDDALKPDTIGNISESRTPFFIGKPVDIEAASYIQLNN